MDMFIAILLVDFLLLFLVYGVSYGQVTYIKIGAYSNCKKSPVGGLNSLTFYDLYSYYNAYKRVIFYVKTIAHSLKLLLFIFIY